MYISLSFFLSLVRKIFVASTPTADASRNLATGAWYSDGRAQPMREITAEASTTDKQRQQREQRVILLLWGWEPTCAISSYVVSDSILATGLNELLLNPRKSLDSPAAEP